MNLILCGMMGAGKTTIGVKIAELTGRRWYDTDGMIADKYGKISDIFEYYGEQHFRKLETETVRELDRSQHPFGERNCINPHKTACRTRLCDISKHHY